MSASRAEKRRALKARTKATDYAESGFRDRSIPAPFATDLATTAATRLMNCTSGPLLATMSAA